VTEKRPRYVATSTVSSRYQTVIPSEIREKFMIREGTHVLWMDMGDTIEVIPVCERSWRHFRGKGKGLEYLAELERHRASERELDEQSSAPHRSGRGE
jgi:AbrB family looped-hinge helix DNA binding protein